MNWGNETQRKMHVKFLLEQYEFLKNPQEICPYLPDAVDIDISNRCNIHCISCFHSVERFRPMEDMDLDTFKLALDQAEGNASTVTIGNHGEPFLHKDVFEMLEEVKKRGFFLNLINNGTLLDEKKSRRLLEIGVDRLVFSLDSVDPQKYPLIRKGARLEVTLKNILNFLKLNCEKGLDTYVNISTVDTQLALKSNPSIFEYFSKLPVHIVYTSPMLNFHNVLSIREETKFLTKYQDAENFKDVPVCLGGFDRILIRPNGNVSLCAIDWDCIHILGNIKDEPYTRLWNNKKAQEFRRALITGDYSEIEKKGFLCSKCDLKWSCFVEKQRDNIVELLASDLEDIKKRRNEEIRSCQGYENLLKELEKLEFQES